VQDRVQQPVRVRGRVAGSSLDGVDDPEDLPAQRDLVRRDEEDRDGDGREHDDVHRAVDCDHAEDDAVAQRLPAERQLDLLARRRRLARRLRRRRERQPRVAAEAAVPA
jgi:hypothetical protein